MKTSIVQIPTWPTVLLSGLLAITLAGCSDDDDDAPVVPPPGPPALSGDPMVTSDAPTDGMLAPGESIVFEISTEETVLAPSVVGRLSTQAAGEGTPASVTGSGNMWVVTYVAAAGGPYGDELTFDITLRNSQGESLSASFTPSPAIGTDDGWVVMWEDDFDRETLNPDTGDNWEVMTGDGSEYGLPAGWGNGELQHYSTDSVTVSGGTMTITATVADSVLSGDATADRGDYQSARIRSIGLREFTYGRVEMRAKLPAGQGTWPAFWMLPSGNEYGAWPLSGEIDIMEATNLGVNGKTAVSAALHYGLLYNIPRGNEHDLATEEHDPTATQAPQDGFHIYAAEWEAGEIRFFFDDTHYATMTAEETWHGVMDRGSERTSDQNRYAPAAGNAPFDQDFHILLNLAVGGTLPGAPPAPMDFDDATFEIDYVRVSRCSAEGTARCVNRNAEVETTVGDATGPAPAFETLKVYDGGSLAVTEVVDGTTYTNTLAAGQYQDQAGVVNTLDDSGGDNAVWHVEFAGEDKGDATINVGNVFLGSGALSDNTVLDDGFEIISEEGLVGQLAFRMRVNSLNALTTLQVKIDSGVTDAFEPRAWRATLTAEHLVAGDSILTDGTWQQYAVGLYELSQDQSGGGLDRADLTNLFVLEAIGGNVASSLGANVDIDDIYIHIACRYGSAEDSDCNIGPRLVTPSSGPPPAPSGDLTVFDNGVLDPRWNNGIGAFDDMVEGGDCVGEGVSACGNVSWAIVSATDTARGNVLEVTHGDTGAFSLVYFQSSGPQDLSAYANGEVRFDIMVSNQGSAGTDPSFRMKVDCLYPCTSGDHDLDVVGNAGWQTVAVNMQGLLGMAGSGLRLSMVNTGLVVWPVPGMQAGVVFQIDNVVWDVNETMSTRPEPPPVVEPPFVPVGPGEGVSIVSRSLGGGTEILVYDDAFGSTDYSLDSHTDSSPVDATATHAATDTGRGQVIRIAHTSDGSIAWVVSSPTLDLGPYKDGVLSFDLLVEAVSADSLNTHWRVKFEGPGADGLPQRTSWSSGTRAHWASAAGTRCSSMSPCWATPIPTFLATHATLSWIMRWTLLVKSSSFRCMPPPAAKSSR